VDETVDLAQLPWPWAAESFNNIVAEHVFEHLPNIEGVLRECARVLRPSGTLEVIMPVGLNAIADPDHAHEWSWQTPDYYCGARHWDVDVGLTVVSKSVKLHSHLQARSRRLHEWLIDTLERLYGQGTWMFDVPMTSGEFEVVFRCQ